MPKLKLSTPSCLPYAATAIPTSVLVGKNFEIVRVFQGYHSSNELKPEIKALLNRDS